MSPLIIATNYAQNPSWLLAATLALYVCRPAWDALCSLVAACRGLAHRRYARARDAAYEAAGVSYRHAGSPPSHAAGGAR